MASSSTPDALACSLAPGTGHLHVGPSATQRERLASWEEHAVRRASHVILAQFHLFLAACIYINYLFGKIEVAVILGRMEDNVYQVPGPQESSAAPACSLRPPGRHARKEENQLSPRVAEYPSQLCRTLNTEDAGLPLSCGAPLAPDL